MDANIKTRATMLVNNNTKGQLVICDEGLSFWGGVSPSTGKIIDTHHPNFGEEIAGKFVLMPSSRGSCSGSGVLLQLARNGIAPSALIFSESENILTLGAVISDRLFNCPVAIIRLAPALYHKLAQAKEAEIKNSVLYYLNKSIPLFLPSIESINLTENDLEMLGGHQGKAKKIAMEIICLMAANQGADALIDVSRAHIDGSILAHEANLDFAEKMLQMGARVSIPTTINAISVNLDNWKVQGHSYDFGLKASRLADAYVNMGAQPTFTCAPYLIGVPPQKDDVIGWSESNAVIFANSVLGARTEKHPDYFDLFIACTGRTPKTGVYLSKNRLPECEIRIVLPPSFDDSIWPMVGWLAGIKSPNKIPLLTGLGTTQIDQDDLKALCAAFGTTSSAAMLHIRGHTPEDDFPLQSQLTVFKITETDLRKLWKNFNIGFNQIDLVAIGSPHASLAECNKFADLMQGKKCAVSTKTIITVGRETLHKIKINGTIDRLETSGVEVISDICWCSITEPVFPHAAEVVMTNSGKYAHYGKALTGRDFRFGSLKDCSIASVGGSVTSNLPDWLSTNV